MPASRTLLTIITEFRRFDVSAPATVPVRDWLTALIDPGPRSARPEDLTLAIAGRAPLPPESSLADVGVLDGAVLHLVSVSPPQESE